MKYTVKKLNTLLDNMDELEALIKQQNGKMSELKQNLKRIKQAINPNFELMFRERLNEHKADIERENQEKQNDPLTSNQITTRAKQRIIKEYSPDLSHYPISESWDITKKWLKVRWEKDRKQLIKDKEIEA